ncbi:hypothetical protein EMIHUDRAFT_218141 [Emiliania huxleyi CCMP1516]|uniref:F-box domain-containing protein n=2 Tax=Emiliania huxleyi TaxID=2903 RepID=A0A0D3I8R6_EMIH1|nr:hypothetical protein EMIHUDRAFT_218141 [Emiliania huxleyi CCMP1516]EOD07651.1 hypothetical protein EMIHUDRAFT_218141 [Emiliania huxleyi CCMP1516]|eukprot:XP_005760080.1 hypothetical protein EMIHUDRAFT_218141 [Emiliania huxleyi CCMP1516]
MLSDLADDLIRHIIDKAGLSEAAKLKAASRQMRRLASKCVERRLKRHRTALKTLATKLSEEASTMIKETLGHCKWPTVLDLSDMKYSSIADLSGMEYSSFTDVAAIADTLTGNEVLTDLNLSGNNIGGGTGWIKASEVKGESKEVGAKGVDYDGELKLVNVVQTGVLAIADALKGNGVLTTLALPDNNIGPGGAAAIAEALRGNVVLTSLDVGGNDLTEEAALSIVRVERQRNKLTSLGLAHCSIGPTGAAEIADYVSGSRVLTELNLDNNNIRDESAAAIAEALRGNRVLKDLSIAYKN